MSFPVLHLVGRRLPAELLAFVHELQRVAIVYSFATTVEMLDGWRLARKNGPQLTFAPQAVVWLQSRAGEFQQAEVAELQTLDPLARPIVVAGCWCEGESRSGRLLTGVTRIYWHQGVAALLNCLLVDEPPQPAGAQWIAIHTAQYVDYQGLAGICESLGHRVLWQAGHLPVTSSEPDLRIFSSWESWQVWRDNQRSTNRSRAILLQDFPRPADQVRAAGEGIAAVVAQPCIAADLERAITKCLAATSSSLRRCDPQTSHNPQPVRAFSVRRSA